MGMSIRLRRVDTSEVERGVEQLERGFAATLKNRKWQSETDAGVLVDLGESWQFINSALADGDQHPVSGPEALPVFGGAYLASVGEPQDAIIVLQPDEVNSAFEFLDGMDFAALLQRESERAKSRFGAGIPEWLMDSLLDKLKRLRTFYGTAAAEGQCVVKRIY
ncbi:DUF1877 family protein [Streptomyces chartreusis]|uniref:DUF1877 family protein n=1 Tax=Streptomyces chartreusis TaxID=1969 RepID=UPI003435F497